MKPRDKGILLLAVCTAALFIPLAGLLGLSASRTRITPNDQFFNVSIGGTPSINASTWTMPINGSVSTPITLTYANLTERFPSVTETVTLKCVDGPTATAAWTGIPLSDVLALAHVSSGAQEIVFFGADGYTTDLTVAECNATGVILAYEMNGATLPADQGYPVILVVPDNYGYKWCKWIVQISAVDYDYMGYWESRGWSNNAQYSASSDWLLHAELFSIAFIFGGLSLISGFKLASGESVFQQLPGFVNRRFHLLMSILFVAMVAITFTYWVSATIILKGAIFNEFHGIVAALAVFLIAGSIVSGFRTRVKDKTIERHPGWGQFAFLVFSFTIILGFLLAF